MKSPRVIELIGILEGYGYQVSIDTPSEGCVLSYKGEAVATDTLPFGLQMTAIELKSLTDGE